MAWLRRLPRLARRRLLLRHDDHDRRRPRQLGRPLAPGGDRRRERHSRCRGARPRASSQFAASCSFVRQSAPAAPFPPIRQEEQREAQAGSRSSTTSGISRSLLRAGNPRSRGTPRPPAPRAGRAPRGLATRAWTGSCSEPTWTVVSGLATRLWYQAGCFGKPPLEATITRSSPSRDVKQRRGAVGAALGADVVEQQHPARDAGNRVAEASTRPPVEEGVDAHEAARGRPDLVRDVEIAGGRPAACRRVAQVYIPPNMPPVMLSTWPCT